MPRQPARFQVNMQGKRIASGIAQAVERAMNETLEEMYDVARAKVPVRKIFLGERRKLRFATAQETLAANRGISRIGGIPELLPAPAGFKGSPTSRAGKRYYRIVEDNSSATRTVRLRNGETKTILNARRPTGRGRQNELFPTLRAQTGSRAGKKFTGDFRALANPAAEGPGRLQHRIGTENLGVRGRYEVSSRRGQHGDRIGGALKASILVNRATLTVAQGGGKFTIVGGLQAGAKRPGPYYARYVELGTTKMAAQPFLRPALHGAREVFRQRVRQQLMRGIGLRGGQTPEVAKAASPEQAFFKAIGII